MNIEWRRIFYSMVCSAVLTLIVAIILFIYTTPYEPIVPHSFLMQEIVITIAEGQGPYLPLWGMIGILLICMIVLTIVFYFVIDYFSKRRK